MVWYIEWVNLHPSNLVLVFWSLPHCWFCSHGRTLLSALSLSRRRDKPQLQPMKWKSPVVLYLCYKLTLLVCSQNTLGTTTKLKCFSSSAHLSEFLASFSKSSSWASVPFRSYSGQNGNSGLTDSAFIIKTRSENTGVFSPLKPSGIQNWGAWTSQCLTGSLMFWCPPQNGPWGQCTAPLNTGGKKFYEVSVCSVWRLYDLYFFS